MMDLKETELRLGQPGGLKQPEMEYKSGIKRLFSETTRDYLNHGCVSGEELSHHSSKSQLVGWPPVRVSRKNAAKASCKYVKVGVDGAPFLRKLDLQSNTTYQQLFMALEEMHCSVGNGNAGEYVATYEDKDGDWMMVSDVPWMMFVESCKRIRLVKTSDGIGQIRTKNGIEG